MAGVYVSIVKELYDRINLKKTELGLKHIQILHKPEALQPDATPYLQIIPDVAFINEEYGASVQQRRKNATVNILIWTEFPIDDRDAENPLYNDDLTSGFLPYIEELLDYLNQDTAGDLNPQLQNATQSMGISVQNIIKQDSTISAEILLSIKTQPFVINNRQQI